MIVIKKRKLKVQGVDDKEAATRLTGALEQLTGIKAVEVSADGSGNRGSQAIDDVL